MLDSMTEFILRTTCADKEEAFLKRRASDKDATGQLSALYDQYAGKLYAYACLLSGSRNEAEDILQESFLRMAGHLEKILSLENPQGYLFKIVRNETFRLRSRWLNWRKHDVAKGTIHLACRKEIGRHAGIDAEHIQQAVKSLPPDQREIMFLKVWQDMTFSEIGELLKISANTAASRYRYGMTALRRKLNHGR